MNLPVLQLHIENSLFSYVVLPPSLYICTQYQKPSQATFPPQIQIFYYDILLLMTFIVHKYFTILTPFGPYKLFEIHPPLIQGEIFQSPVIYISAILRKNGLTSFTKLYVFIRTNKEVEFSFCQILFCRRNFSVNWPLLLVRAQKAGASKRMRM